MNNVTPLRGEIWLVDLDPTVGHEQAKKRPCLVISADTFNKGAAELVVVVPITSQYRQISWFVEVKLASGNLPKQSFIMSNQIRTVSIERFSKRALGIVTLNVLEQVDARIRILLCL